VLPLGLRRHTLQPYRQRVRSLHAPAPARNDKSLDLHDLGGSGLSHTAASAQFFHASPHLGGALTWTSNTYGDYLRIIEERNGGLLGEKMS